MTSGFVFATATGKRNPKSLFRHSTSDALFVALSFAHAALLIAVPSVALIAIGMWWNSNTIAHNFIHRPFFRARSANRIYSGFLSLVLGVPQSLWRDRHLAHHAGITHRLRPSAGVVVETTLIAGLWVVIGFAAPGFFLTVYLPGMAIGLVLCQLQGFFEHAGGTTSHYGRLYNFLFFNDGYHVEHHQRPGVHWTQLRGFHQPAARRSRWPPVLRWLDYQPLNLETLERAVLRSPRLQRFVLTAHERAFRRVLARAGTIEDVLVVGGGLFPRTALVLRRLLPTASITVIDANREHLAVAKPWLDPSIAFVHDRFDAGIRTAADLIVIPLSFTGHRRSIYTHPPARVVIVHDWIWARRRGQTGAVVSWLLLKRLNLVEGLREPSASLATTSLSHHDYAEPVQRARAVLPSPLSSASLRRVEAIEVPGPPCSAHK
jgi:fatty acid desaturase